MTKPGKIYCRIKSTGEYLSMVTKPRILGLLGYSGTTPHDNLLGERLINYNSNLLQCTYRLSYLLFFNSDFKIFFIFTII